MPEHRPAEHCGHQPPSASEHARITECVLRPDHSGSHADGHGMRWWLHTEEQQSTSTSRPLARGDVLHGYAGGIFGRDHYSCCRIEAAGPDWIVARDEDGHPSFASGTQSLQSLQRNRDKPCTIARHRQLDGDAEARCPLDLEQQRQQPTTTEA